MAEAAVPFTWGAGGAQMAPEQVTAQQKIASLMMQQGTDASPIRSWTQGAARVAQAMLGGYMSKEADDEAKVIRTRDRDALMSVIGGQTAAPIPAAPATPAAPAAPSDAFTIASDGGLGPPAAANPNYRDAVASIESAGQKNPYGVLGPVTTSGDRAHGRYQVMGANIGPWTKAALGQELTPEQFLANPAAQDKVFDHRFGGYVAQTGNPQDAASMWFTGKPLAQGAGLRDQLGTTGQTYVQKFARNLVPTAAVAAAGPAAPPNATPTEESMPGQAAPVAAPAPPAVSPGAQAVAAAMKPQAGGIPDNQKDDIRKLLSTTPGSPAYQLGMSLVGKAVAKEKEDITPMTPAERQQWQVPSGMSAGIDRSNGKPVFSPASTNVAVTSVADPIAAGVGKQFDEGLKAARTASREVIPIIHDARAQLDSGAFTGSASNLQVGLQKIGAVFGMSDKEAANTETFRSTIGRQVLTHAKALGANPSNADRDFIKEVEGGSGTMQETTLRRLLDLSEKYARTSIRNHNADAERLLKVQPDAYKGVAPLLSVQEPDEYKKPTATAAPAVTAAAPGKVRKYNPATGMIE